MKRLLLTIFIAGLMLTGCGRNISKEKDVLFETVSMEESGAATSESIQQNAEASEETMESSEPEETKENNGDKGEPEETASTASKPEESEPSAASTPKPTKTPAATEKPAKEPEATNTAAATAKPTAASEPAQAPVAANTPEPAKAPEQTPTPVQTHTHTYVEETTPATCTEAAVVTTKCSSCGEVSGTRTEGSALGHDFEEKFSYYATCTTTGHHYFSCKRCGVQQGAEDIPMLPHDYEVTVLLEGDCQSPRVTEKVCKVCGCPEPREYDYDAHKDDHVWVTETGQVYDKEQHAWVDATRTVCAVCNKEKPN